MGRPGIYGEKYSLETRQKTEDSTYEEFAQRGKHGDFVGIIQNMIWILIWIPYMDIQWFDPYQYPYKTNEHDMDIDMDQLGALSPIHENSSPFNKEHSYFSQSWHGMEQHISRQVI